MQEYWTRRKFFRDSLLVTLGTALGALGASCRKSPTTDDKVSLRHDHAPSGMPREEDISLAVSLSGLQEQIAQSPHGVPERFAHLSMTHIHGLMIESNGEVLLLGSAKPGVPPLALEALVIALRNANQNSPLVADDYRGVLGCTIDPWGQDDPWRIQKTEVFGMPHSVSMGFRHVYVDYHLKKVSAGLQRLGTGNVQSLWDLWRAKSPLCGVSTQDGETSMSHRYWFCPQYAQAPRFSEEGGTILIHKPIGVQVLTEKMFWSQTGQHTGAAPADPMAEQFAGMVTAAMASDDIPPEYIQLRQDFRLIEVAQLLRFKRVSAERLIYFLQDFPLKSMPTPKYVTGIHREEHGEIVCEGEITEEEVPNGTVVHSNRNLQRYHATYRGGVEAKVEVVHEHIEGENSGKFAQLRTRVRESRPSVQTLMWSVKE